MSDFITAYGPKLRVFAPSADDGRTKQAFREESEIKNIIKKYQRTGLLEFRESNPTYQDLEAIDFHEAMNIVTKAQEMFEDLPSSMRKRLGNDPAEFVDLVTNPARIEESIALGLRQKPEAPTSAPEPSPVPPAAPAAPAAS